MKKIHAKRTINEYSKDTVCTVTIHVYLNPQLLSPSDFNAPFIFPVTESNPDDGTLPLVWLLFSGQSSGQETRSGDHFQTIQSSSHIPTSFFLFCVVRSVIYVLSQLYPMAAADNHVTKLRTVKGIKIVKFNEMIFDPMTSVRSAT